MKRFTDRHGVEKQHDSGKEQKNHQGADNVPLVVPPDYVLQGLERGRKPQERSCRTAGDRANLLGPVFLGGGG